MNRNRWIGLGLLLALLVIVFLQMKKSDKYCHFVGWMPTVQCKSAKLVTLETAVADPASPEALSMDALLEKLFVKKFDKNGDGVVNTEDLPARSCDCTNGRNGLHCWDQNGDGLCRGDDDCDKSGVCDQADCLCLLRKKLSAEYKSKPKPKAPPPVVDLDELEEDLPVRVGNPPPSDTSLEIKTHVEVPPSYESETSIRTNGSGFKIRLQSATEVRN